MGSPFRLSMPRSCFSTQDYIEFENRVNNDGFKPLLTSSIIHTFYHFEKNVKVCTDFVRCSITYNIFNSDTQKKTIINNLMYGGKSEHQEQLPTQQYLENVFVDLANKKQSAKYKNIPIGTYKKGYKTIPIQKLQEKNIPLYIGGQGKQLWKKDLVKEIYCYEQSCCLSKKYENGFFGAFFEAYINHGDVQITPDDVWMAILLYFSKYVNDNAQKLRNAFVFHQGKKQLVIKTTRETSQYQWNQFFEKVIAAIKQNTVKGVTDTLGCSYSTTDKFFNFFSTATIMNTYQKYFDYTRMICICGIQNIHMGGTLEDWQKVGSRLTNLKQFDVNGDLKYYVRRLQPVLDQFIQTFKGEANLEFWNNIYHERKDPYARAYQPKMFANGWILRFFTTKDVISSELAIEEIDVPIKLVNEITQTVKKLNLVGGCRGISLSGNAYRPHYSFAIVEKDLEKQQKEN